MSVGGACYVLPLHLLIHSPYFQVDIIMGMDSGDLSDFVENVEWECRGMPATKNVIMYGCCSDPYPDITYTVLLQRRSSFYIFNLLLPCFLISFLAPLGFYLPADSGEKVSLGVTVLLALTVFQLMVAESMPPSESVPLIGMSVFVLDCVTVSIFFRRLWHLLNYFRGLHTSLSLCFKPHQQLDHREGHASLFL